MKMINTKVNEILWEIHRLKREVNFVECNQQDLPNSGFLQLSQVWCDLDNAEDSLSKYRNRLHKICEPAC